MLYVGIDQHRKHLTVNIRDEAGDVILRRQVSTQWERVADFFGELRTRSEAQGGFAAVVEVCGFNDWLLELLPGFGCREVIVVQPRQRAAQKTDRRDAQSLSELLWVNRQRLLSGRPVRGLRRVALPQGAERDDRRLTALRRNVACELTRIINRIKHLLRRHNLEQDCPAKGIQTQTARNWLRTLPLDSLDRLELDHNLQRWELLEKQKLELERRIAERQPQSADAVLLRSLPGAGPYMALGLACRVGDVRRFPRPDSLVNYWGLAPNSNNSGDATQRLGSITKQGSAMARFLLGQLVLHVLRKDPHLRAWFRRIKLRRGAKIARVAVMRRLTMIIWHMLSKREKYEPGGPPRRRLAQAAIPAEV